MQNRITEVLLSNEEAQKEYLTEIESMEYFLKMARAPDLKGQSREYWLWQVKETIPHATQLIFMYPNMFDNVTE